MKRLGAFAARWVLALLGLAVLTVASLFVVGAFLTTYPILRLSPRDRRLKAGLDAAMAVAALVAAIKPEPDEDPEPDDDDDPEPLPPAGKVWVTEEVWRRVNDELESFRAGTPS